MLFTFEMLEVVLSGITLMDKFRVSALETTEVNAPTKRVEKAYKTL